MATLYPADLSGLDDHVHGAEKQFHRACAALDDSYTVYHSVTWTNRAGEGEADFVILHRTRGVTVVEVKGGAVSVEDGRWYSRDRHGVQHAIRNPVEQAQRSLRALMEHYQSRWQGAWPGNFGWAVCLLDVVRDGGPLSLDLDANCITARDLEDLGAWFRRYHDAREAAHGARALGPDEHRRLDGLFSKKMELSFSLNVLIRQQKHDLLQVNAMQDYLLDLFEDKRRIAFQGPAGTGKTWIAMKKARRLAEEGRQVLLLTYNRPVNQFIAEKFAGYPSVTVATFHAFALNRIAAAISACVAAGSAEAAYADFARAVYRALRGEQESDGTGNRGVEGLLALFEHGAPSAELESAIVTFRGALGGACMSIVELLAPVGDAPGDYYAERMPLALMAALEAHPDGATYDAVIIDEGQDFHPQWCEALKMLFDRYRDRIVYLFYDDNQTIFTRTRELPVTGLIAKSGIADHVFRLRDNLRNTRNIQEYAVRTTSCGGTAAPPQVDGIDPVEEQLRADALPARLASILEELTATHGIRTQQIRILSNRSFANSALAAHRSLAGFTVVHTGKGASAKSVAFRTVHQFKGLESDVVILLWHERAEDAEDHYSRNELRYVACTRAKYLLYVLRISD